MEQVLQQNKSVSDWSIHVRTRAGESAACPASKNARPIGGS